MEVLVRCQTALLKVNDLVLGVIKNLRSIPHAVNRFSSVTAGWNDFIDALFALFFFFFFFLLLKSPQLLILKFVVPGNTIHFNLDLISSSSNPPCVSSRFLFNLMLCCISLSFICLYFPSFWVSPCTRWCMEVSGAHSDELTVASLHFYRQGLLC